jgi:hypothetical protein
MSYTTYRLGIAACALALCTQSIAQQVEKERIDQAVQVINSICLSGKQYDLQVDARGNIVFKNLKPGAEASATISARSSSGATAISEERLRLIADSQVRDCMKPYLPRLLDALLGGRGGKTSGSTSAEIGRASTTESISKLPAYKAVASSEQSDSRSAQNALREGRSWVTRKGETRGAWLDVYLHHPCLVSSIAYYLRFPKYGAYSQIRNATLNFDDGTRQRVTFEFSPGWQRVELEPRRADRVRVVVDDVFPAGSGDQVEVAQMEFYGTACEK